jgi:hypothetical protein
MDIVHKTLDEIVPKKRIKVRRRAIPLLLGHDTRNVIRLRDLAREKDHKHQYKQLRNKCCKLIRRDWVVSKMNYIRQQKNEQQAFWDVANDIIQPKSTDLPLLRGMSTDLESANMCNRYYINKVENLRAKMPLSKHKLSSEKVTLMGPRFSISCVSIADVKKAIHSLGNSKAAGHDELPAAFWRGTTDAVAGSLTSIINQSITTGSVPDDWKKATIIPLHKGGGKDRTEPSSYRPVALLPVASKIMEKIVYEQLRQHVETHDLLPQQQHGFRRCRSTTTALTAAVYSWARSMDLGKAATRNRLEGEGQHCAVTAFDFSAAFDTISVDQMLEKLRAIGADHRAVQWFQSYMTGGKQRVQWNNALSSYIDVRHGVRQGSILGPLLFIILTSDIPKCSSLTNSIIYADDTTSWNTAGSLSALEMHVEHAAVDLKEMSANLKLSLNMDKTQLMVLGSKHHSSSLAGINNSTKISVLGLVLDNKLSPTLYNELQLKAARYRLGVLRRVASRVPPFILRPLVHGLLLGKLRVYANLTHHVRLDMDDSRPAISKKLQVVVNDAARLLLRVRRVDHNRVEHLLAKAELPSFNSMVFATSATMAWQMAQGGPLHNIYQDLQLSSNTRASAANELRVADIPSREVAVHNAARVWNRFPELRTAKSLGTVKTIVRKLQKNLPL